MANKTPVWYDGGFGVYNGDDTIHHNYTDSTGNVLTLEKGGTGNEVLQVLNKGELTLKSITGAASAALTIQGLTAQDLLTISDHENADHILTVRKLTSGSGWITDFKVRDSGAPSNDDVALRITHDIQTNTPPQGADLISLGYTNASEVYQELFAMKQSGDLYLQGTSGADLLWGTDSGGNIGGSSGNRPDNVYAAATVNAAGSVLQTLSVQLGPAGATDKTITALQAATSPYIKFVNGSAKWQFSNDGTTPLDFGTSNVASWDDLYALDKTLTIDGAALTFTQTSTSGQGFTVTRNLPSGSTGLPIMGVSNQNAGDDQQALAVTSSGGPTFAAALGGAPTGTVSIINSTALISSALGASSDVRCFDTALYPNAGDNAGAYYRGFYAVGSATGSAIKYAFNADANWNYGLYSESKIRLILSNVINPLAQRIDVTSSGNTVGFVTPIVDINFTQDAADIATINGIDLGLSPDASATSETRGVYVDGNWTYGLYSESPIKENMLGITETTRIVEVVGTSGGLGATGKKVSLVDIQWAEHASAEVAYIYGVNIDLTPDVSASNTKYGVKIDNNWTHGFHSASPGHISRGSLTGSDNCFSVVANSSGLGGIGNEVNLTVLDFTEDASDSDVVNGIKLLYTKAGGANTSKAINVDTDWTYGIYSSSPGYIGRAGLTGSDDSFSVIATSNDLGGVGNEVNLINLSFTENAADSDVVNGIKLQYTTAGGANTTKAVNVNNSWDYGLSSASPAQVLLSSVTTTKIACEFGVGTSSLGAAQTATICRATYTASGTDDASSIVRGFHAVGDAGSASINKQALLIDAAWDYGVYSLAATNSFYYTFPATTVNTTPIVGVVATTPGTAMGASSQIYAVKTTINANSADPATTDYYGFHSTFVPNSTTSGDMFGLYLTGYGHYSSGKVGKAIVSDGGVSTLYHAQVDGFSGSEIDLLKTSMVSSGTGLNASDVASCLRVRVGADADDAGEWNGVYAEGPTTTITGGATTYAFQANSDWDYGFYSTSDVAVVESGFTGGVNKAVIVGMTSGGLTSALSALTAVNLDVDGHANDTAGTVTALSIGDHNANGGSLTATRAIITGLYWQYALKAVSGHIDQQATFASLYDTSAGMVNVVATNSTALSDTARYSVKSYVYGHASDASSATLYNFHANADTTGSAAKIAYYAGASGSNGLWYGFRSQNVPYGLYCENGQAQVTAQSGAYTPTASTSALIYTNLTSSGFTTGAATWYNNASRYTYNASDTDGTWYGYFAETNGTPVAGVQTIGYKAQANLDIGFESYAPENRFQRADDISSTTAPTVLIQNMDNDSTGGTAPALLVENAYTAITGTAIEIAHAYNGGNTQDTMRAIVLSNTSRNRRTSPIELWQPRMANTTTAEWYLTHGTPGSSQPAHYWSVASSTGEDSIFAPLVLPHGSTLQTVVVYLYLAGAPPSAGNRVKAHVYKKSYSLTITNAILATGEVSSGTGTQTISLTSIADTVDARTYSYFVEIEGPAVSGYTTVYALGLYYEYDITDLGAAPGY